MNMSDDYQLLNLGGLTSLVTNVTMSLWGHDVAIECLYDPTGDRLPYILNFQDCREIRWEIHDPEEVHETFAELIGIHLGEGDRQKPALIHTDIFEISLLYGTFNLERIPSSQNILQTKPLVEA